MLTLHSAIGPTFSFQGPIGSCADCSTPQHTSMDPAGESGHIYWRTTMRIDIWQLHWKFGQRRPDWLVSFHPSHRKSIPNDHVLYYKWTNQGNSWYQKGTVITDRRSNATSHSIQSLSGAISDRKQYNHTIVEWKIEGVRTPIICHCNRPQLAARAYRHCECVISGSTSLQ